MSAPTTRREALIALAITGAATAAPAALLAKGHSHREAWDAAMTRWHKARAVERAADHRWQAAADTYADITGKHPLKPVSEGGIIRVLDEPGRLSGFTQADHVVEAASEALSAVSRELILLQAPDSEALLWKLDHLFGSEAMTGEETHAPGYCLAWMDAVMDDARRLLTVGRA